MNINDSIPSLYKTIGTYQTAQVSKTQQPVVVPAKTTENTRSTDPNNIEDKAEISQTSKDLLSQEKVDKSTNKADKELSPEEKKQVDELKKTDTQVKAHEQAHMAAASGIATGGPSYGYEQGPDGKQYAVSGEVNISVSSESNPEQTIQNAEQAKNAALAPRDPSDQDRNVARQAEQMIQKAKTELNNNPDKANPFNKAYDKQSSRSPGVLVDMFG